jgi:hypothetical protein
MLLKKFAIMLIREVKKTMTKHKSSNIFFIILAIILVLIMALISAYGLKINQNWILDPIYIIAVLIASLVRLCWRFDKKQNIKWLAFMSWVIWFSLSDLVLEFLHFDYYWVSVLEVIMATIISDLIFRIWGYTWTGNKREENKKDDLP